MEANRESTRMTEAQARMAQIRLVLSVFLYSDRGVLARAPHITNLRGSRLAFA